MGASVGTGTSAGPGPISPPRQTPAHVYRPTYQGLGVTPQASQFTPQVPSFRRAPMMPVQRPTYQVGMQGPQQLSPERKLLNVLSRTGNAVASKTNSPITGAQLSPAQYQLMMKNPSLFLPLVQSTNTNQPQPVSGQYRPVPFMTQAQAQRYNRGQTTNLARLLGPAPSDSSSNDGGG